MGLGKITRGLGKVGAALEGVRLIVTIGVAIVRAIRSKSAPKLPSE